MKASGKPCPICSCKSTVSPEDDEYLRCLECGVIRTQYDYEASQYSVAYAMNYLEYAKSPVNKSLNLFRLGLVARWLKENSTILDVGCCVGEFLRFAERHYECDGFEPNPVAAREAVKRTHSTIFESLNGHKQYNCITMFDVLEHIQQPKTLLTHLDEILRPRGIIAITTPDASCVIDYNSVTIDGNIRAWKHWKPREHLFLFTQRSLSILFEGFGFEVVHHGNEESDIRPGNPHRDIITCVVQKS